MRGTKTTIGVNDFHEQRNSFWPWLECVDSYDITDICRNASLAAVIVLFPVNVPCARIS